MELLEGMQTNPFLQGSTEKGRTWLQLLASVLFGLGQAASIAWPFSLDSSGLGLQAGAPVWWLQLLSLAGLAWQLIGIVGETHPANARTRWRQAGISAGLFSIAWFTGTFGWIFVALHTYGGLPAWLAAMAVVALGALLALYMAFACALFGLLAPVNKAWSAILFSALWLLAELARGTWFTGFGWGAAGYAHLTGPLAGYIPWVGVYGVTALSCGLAMMLSYALQPARLSPFNSPRIGRRQMIGFLTIFLLLLLPQLLNWGFGSSSQSAGTRSITLLQGNIPQNEKFEVGIGVPQALDWYAGQLKISRSSLVIAPETAIPVLPQQLPPGYWASLTKRFTEGTKAALIGMPLGNYETGYTNSVIGLKPGQTTPWHYDKHHLVPFGEFIPPFFKWFVALMNMPLGDFARGPLPQAPFEWEGQRWSAAICYEDLFSEELAQQFTEDSLAPTIFFNVSNLAWFGAGLAMDQHLSIARMRALEFERPFVLATNTGLTAIVDHHGQISSALSRATRGVLDGEVEGRIGVTPYARWVAHLGLWPLWLMGFGVVLMAAMRRGRNH